MLLVGSHDLLLFSLNESGHLEEKMDFYFDNEITRAFMLKDNRILIVSSSGLHLMDDNQNIMSHSPLHISLKDISVSESDDDHLHIFLLTEDNELYLTEIAQLSTLALFNSTSFHGQFRCLAHSIFFSHLKHSLCVSFAHSLCEIKIAFDTHHDLEVERINRMIMEDTYEIMVRI